MGIRHTDRLRRAALGLAWWAWAGLLAACSGGEAPREQATKRPEEPPPGVEVPPVTPFQSSPRLLSHDSAAGVLRQAYTSAGAYGSGRIIIWLQIDTAGRVREARLAKHSSLPELEDRVVQEALRLRFEPARTAGAPVPVWVQLPVDFHAGEPPRIQLDTTAWHIPRFVGFAQAPRFARPAQAESLLQAIVIPATESGGRGTVVLDIHFSETGEVLAEQVAHSSGHPELDEAVRRWVRSVRFTPTIDSAGRPIDAWVSLPIRVGEREKG